MENRITEHEINGLIDRSERLISKAGKKTTVMITTLPNGFEITTSSSCVDPDNYDQDVGEKICIQRLRDKLWIQIFSPTSWS